MDLSEYGPRSPHLGSLTHSFSCSAPSRCPIPIPRSSAWDQSPLWLGQSLCCPVTVTALPGCVTWSMSGGLELDDLSGSFPSQAILWSYPCSSLGTQTFFGIFPVWRFPRLWEHRSSSPGGSSSGHFQGLVLLPPWSGSLPSISCRVAFGSFLFLFCQQSYAICSTNHLSFCSLSFSLSYHFIKSKSFSFWSFLVTNVRELK